MSKCVGIVMVFDRMVQADRPCPGCWKTVGELRSLGPLSSKPERLLEPRGFELELFARPGNEEFAMMGDRKVVGIDVSKATLDCAAVPIKSAVQLDRKSTRLNSSH